MGSERQQFGQIVKRGSSRLLEPRRGKWASGRQRRGSRRCLHLECIRSGGGRGLVSVRCAVSDVQGVVLLPVDISLRVLCHQDVLRAGEGREDMVHGLVWRRGRTSMQVATQPMLGSGDQPRSLRAPRFRTSKSQMLRFWMRSRACKMSGVGSIYAYVASQIDGEEPCQEAVLE
jgi:hypothetical protein